MVVYYKLDHSEPEYRSQMLARADGKWVKRADYETDLAAARAEIERLTKERDEQYEENVNRIAMQAKAEAERDEALVQMAGAFEVAAQTLIDRFAEADAAKIRALVPAGAQTALQSMLADAERDMRQRAADDMLHFDYDGAGRKLADRILALPISIESDDADNGDGNA